jgi:hypothetical protein
LLNVFEGKNLRGFPDFLKDHFCGDLPDPEDTTTEVRGWVMALECFVIGFKY